MPKNKLLMLVGIAATAALVVVGIIWASSVKQPDTFSDQNPSSVNQNEDTPTDMDDMSDSDMEMMDDSVTPTPPPPPTTVTPPPTTTTPPPTPPTPPAPVTVNVSISNFAYVPAELHISPGTTVVWTNNDSAGHTVTSESGIELDSVLLGNGESFSHTFNTSGEFNYLCKPHPWMKGKVIVQ